MKILKIIGIIVLFIIGHYSCNDHDAEFIPSVTAITMEGEGGTETITFATGDWRIAGIINKNGDQRIFGEIFNPEGGLVKENSLLELDDLGKLNASWTDKGFNICRNTSNTLRIELYENATPEEFDFCILIENEGENREILVNQKISEGYTFENIEYYLSGDDRDSLYVKKESGYEYNTLNPLETTIYPFSSVEDISLFVSNDPLAFVWFENDFPKVKVPSSIIDGKIDLSYEEKTYGEIFRNRYEGWDTIKEKLVVPAGNNKYHVELEWRDRRTSYRMTMKNNRTGHLKTIEGKWIETAPTGMYTIIKDY